MRYFFFGTLMDSDALEVVLGRRVESDALCSARLDGYERRTAAEESYPVLVPTPGAALDGVVVDLTSEETERLAFFEESEYSAETVIVTLAGGERIEARSYTNSTMEIYRNTPWALERWQATEKETFMILARRWMELFGSASTEEADEEWDRVKAELETRRARSLKRAGDNTD